MNYLNDDYTSAGPCYSGRHYVVRRWEEIDPDYKPGDVVRLTKLQEITERCYVMLPEGARGVVHIDHLDD